MKYFQNFLIGILLISTLSFAARFDISSVSTCTQQSENGFCTRWQQNGTVEEQLGACFPQNTQLYVFQNGNKIIKQMKDIQIGDLVLTEKDGSQVYTEVLFWIHRKQNQEITYLDIQTSKGKFLTSHWHNIALKDGSYAFAKELINEELLGDNLKVSDMKNVTEKGLYAPMTRQASYFVLTDSKEKVLAHSFANIRNPEMLEPLFNFIVSTWEVIYGKPEISVQIHPAVEWMTETLGYFVHK